MNWKDDPEVLDFMKGLKHQSSTIGSDVQDAFENAETLEEFKQSAGLGLTELYEEANGVADNLRKLELASEEEKSEAVTPQDVKDLVITTLDSVVKELDAIKAQINSESKKLRIVHVIVEEFGGVVDDVTVYSDEKKADEHRVNFIKKHYSTAQEYRNQLENGMPKNVITQHKVEVK